MQKLDNGKYLLNGMELEGHDLTNMSVAECPCGWSTVNNAMWAYFDYQEHDCLTKAGKPRKTRLEGRLRSATVEELWESTN